MYKTHKLDLIRGSRIEWLEKRVKELEAERDHYRRLWEESERKLEKGKSDGNFEKVVG